MLVVPRGYCINLDILEIDSKGPPFTLLRQNAPSFRTGMIGLRQRLLLDRDGEESPNAKPSRSSG